MDYAFILIVAKLSVSVGAAVWMTVVLINHYADWRSSLRDVAATMGMQPLSEDADFGSPLLARRVTSRALHQLALIVIASLQAAVAVLLWFGAASLVLALTDRLNTSTAAANAALGFVGFSALWFVFLVSGLWFAYHIKMSALQLTHLALLLVGLAGALLMLVRP